MLGPGVQRLATQAARADLAHALPPTPRLWAAAATSHLGRPSLLAQQARSFATKGPACARSLLLSSLAARSSTAPAFAWSVGRLPPQPLPTIASSALSQRRSLHATPPAPVIRDSYFQDDRRRSNSRHGGRPPPSQDGWERLTQAFWQAVLRFERLPTNTVLALIIAPNVVVYLLWQSAEFFRSPQLMRTMLNNFMLSDAHVRAGKWWTLFTCNFSHTSILHLGVNMFCLASIARGVIPNIGNTRFAGLYLLAGVGGSVLSLVSRQVIPRKAPAVGASAGIAGTFAFFATAFPKEKVLLMFVVPLQIKYAVSAWAAYDLFAEFYYGANRAVDGSAHLGGMAVGVLFFALLRKRYRW